MTNRTYTINSDNVNVYDSVNMVAPNDLLFVNSTINMHSLLNIPLNVYTIEKSSSSSSLSYIEVYQWTYRGTTYHVYDVSYQRFYDCATHQVAKVSYTLNLSSRTYEKSLGGFTGVNVKALAYGYMILNANGGSGARQDDISTVVSRSGETSVVYVIPNYTPTREGYTFLGWSYDPSATTASYHAGDTIYPLCNTGYYVYNNLYAVWKRSSNLYINVGGTWKEAQIYENVGGTWKTGQAYENVGGTWRQ